MKVEENHYALPSVQEHRSFREVTRSSNGSWTPFSCSRQAAADKTLQGQAAGHALEAHWVP